MTIKKLRFVSATLLSMLVTVFISCNNDNDFDDNDRFDDGIGLVQIKAATNFNGPTTGTSSVSKRVIENVEIVEFLVNISEIELEFEEEDDSRNDDGYYGSDDEVELKGPFELNLMVAEAVLTSANIPNAIYEEIEFEFEKGRDSSSELFGKTILIRGFIEDIPFEFWYDFDEEVEVDFDDSNVDIRIEGFDNEITINFDLNEVLDVTSGIDLSTAQDGNADGLIEISPNDDDGNRNLARRLKEKLEESIELLDD